MKIIGIINQKGGVGKTTLSTCLAVAFEQDNKKVALMAATSASIKMILLYDMCLNILFEMRFIIV